MQGTIQIKDPKTVSEQVKILRDNHHLIVDNDVEAEQILRKTNYYRLIAYGLGLTEPSNKEIYCSGVSFQQLIQTYHFDQDLRSLLYKPLECIEVQFKTQVAYYHVTKYGAEGYLSPSNFLSKTQKGSSITIHQKVIDEFRIEIDRQKMRPIVKHHQNKYGGHYPLWVAVEIMPFGSVVSLFSVMLDDDRKAIANLYNCKPNYLNSWLQSIREVRNICAHFNRLYNMPLKQTPFLYSEHKQFQSNKLFPIILVLKRLLAGSREWSEFLEKLKNLILQNNSIVSLNLLGFPAEWVGILEK